VLDHIYQALTEFNGQRYIYVEDVLVATFCFFFCSLHLFKVKDMRQRWLVPICKQKGGPLVNSTLLPVLPKQKQLSFEEHLPKG